MHTDNIPDGYTRISEILSIFQAYAFVEKSRLKRAQDIGTCVHQSIESYYRGEFYPVPFQLTPYLESFFKIPIQIEPVIIETRFNDDSLKITGKIDVLGKIERSPVLIDFKTGSWAHPEIWKLQGTFYRMLLEINLKDKNLLPNKFLFVQLQKDGCTPILHEFDFDQNDVQVCKSAIDCYHYFKRNLR